MNAEKRKARTKRRAKSMRIIRNTGVRHTCSKWSIHGTWNDSLTPGEVQGVRKKARRDGELHD